MATELSQPPSTVPAEALVEKYNSAEKRDSSFEQVEEQVEELNFPRLTPEHQKRIMRKVDWHVVPLLSFLYLVSFIDRGNCEHPIIRLLPCSRY
jgi:hypothetical protein